MLETKVQGVCVDNTGAIITIKDVTGVYSVGNQGGLGTPNPSADDIQKIVITLSKYNSPKILQAIWERNPSDPNDTSINSTPTVAEILEGADINLNSLVFRATTPQEGIKVFEDGVFDINVYYVVEPLTVQGTKGDIYLEGANLDDTFLTYDSVLVGKKLYAIDKTLDTNGGTLLYLEEPLEVNVTEVDPAYRANTKVANMAHSNCCLTQIIGRYAQSKSCSKSLNKITDILIDHTAARLAFQNDDYQSANDLMTNASQRCKHSGGCKGC